MTFKFIQINIFKGKYLSDLLDFLKSENPDFISMQEVTTGGFNLYFDKHVSLFDLLGDCLKMHGVFHGDLKLAGDPSSVFGNAVFSKKRILKSNVVVLKKFRPVTNAELDGESGEIREQIDRHLLDAEIDLGTSTIHIMSWHGAWTAPPHDTQETLRQARLVYDYVKTISSPFILGGDLNAIIESKAVGMIGELASNLMMNSGVDMTTNIKVHKIAPRGFLIDYIFTSKHFELIKLEVPQITVSDHLPVVASLEYKG